MPKDRPEPGFALEVEDLARRLDGEFLDLERAQDPGQRAARVAGALKTAHTLKGSAAVVGQPMIAHVCHLLEGLLQQLPGAQAADAQMLSLMLEASSSLCAAAQVLREGGPSADELLLPTLERLESYGGPGWPAAAVAPRPLPAPSIAPVVRVTDQELDHVLGLSEELHYAATALRMRQDQLEMLCEDFASLLGKSQKRGDAGRFGAWTKLLNRLEAFSEASQRCARGLQKVSAGFEAQLQGLRLVSMGSAGRAFEHVVRDTAIALGKEVAFTVEDSGTELDLVDCRKPPRASAFISSATRSGIASSSPRKREAKGKPRCGQLRIIAKPKGGWAEHLGRGRWPGIDADRVRQRAAELHLPLPANETECLALLLRGGLSTASTVTELSGRGLGLSIVHDRVEQMHGHITVTTTVEQGSRFVITVPMTLTRMRLLFLAAGANVFGVPSTGVRRLVHPSATEVLEETLNDSAGAHGTPVKLGSLARVLGIHEDQIGTGRREALVLGDDAGEAAFVVDALIREDEAVVRSLGLRLKSAAAYLGGTLLPEGRVALVLNPGYLIDAAAHHPRLDLKRAPPEKPDPASSPAARPGCR